MAIKPGFTLADVRRHINKQVRKHENRVLMYMSAIGEQCVNIARSIPPETGFNDQTGNLRSSMGYVFYHNGRKIRDNFTQVLDGKDGIKQGHKLAKQVSEDHMGKIVLVVVAGMQYAVEVESRGRDVLTSAELYAEKRVKELKFKKFSL